MAPRADLKRPADAAFHDSLFSIAEASEKKARTSASRMIQPETLSRGSNASYAFSSHWASKGTQTKEAQASGSKDHGYMNDRHVPSAIGSERSDHTHGEAGSRLIIPSPTRSIEQAITMDDTALSDDEVDIRPCKDKGKGKMKYLPELPEEVWRKVWAMYYNQCALEWHNRGSMQHALKPLLLSSSHMRTALPVLYSHPHVSHLAIPAFIRAISNVPSISRHSLLADREREHDMLGSLDGPESELEPVCASATAGRIVRHLTIKPSMHFRSQTCAADRKAPGVHPSLLQVFLLLPQLVTLHLKDTLVLNVADANNLFSSLQQVSPRKARLEIRMWDLSDSPFGEDLLAATRASIHTTMTRSIPPSSISSTAAAYGNFNDRLRAGLDPGKYAVQEQWRDALWKGVDLDLPPWWIDLPNRDNQHHGPGGHGPGPGPGPGGTGHGGGGPTGLGLHHTWPFAGGAGGGAGDFGNTPGGHGNAPWYASLGAHPPGSSHVPQPIPYAPFGQPLPVPLPPFAQAPVPGHAVPASSANANQPNPPSLGPLMNPIDVDGDGDATVGGDSGTPARASTVGWASTTPARTGSTPNVVHALHLTDHLLPTHPQSQQQQQPRPAVPAISSNRPSAFDALETDTPLTTARPSSTAPALPQTLSGSTVASDSIPTGVDVSIPAPFPVPSSFFIPPDWPDSSIADEDRGSSAFNQHQVQHVQNLVEMTGASAAPTGPSGSNTRSPAADELLLFDSDDESESEGSLVITSQRLRAPEGGEVPLSTSTMGLTAPSALRPPLGRTRSVVDLTDHDHDHDALSNWTVMDSIAPTPQPNATGSGTATHPQTRFGALGSDASEPLPINPLSRDQAPSQHALRLKSESQGRNAVNPAPIEAGQGSSDQAEDYSLFEAQLARERNRQNILASMQRQRQLLSRQRSQDPSASLSSSDVARRHASDWRQQAPSWWTRDAEFSPQPFAGEINGTTKDALANLTSTIQASTAGVPSAFIYPSASADEAPSEPAIASASTSSDPPSILEADEAVKSDPGASADAIVATRGPPHIVAEPPAEPGWYRTRNRPPLGLDSTGGDKSVTQTSAASDAHTTTSGRAARSGIYRSAAGQELIDIGGRTVRVLRPPAVEPPTRIGNRGPTSSTAGTLRHGPMTVTAATANGTETLRVDADAVPGHYLAHVMRSRLRALITDHWSPTLQALSFVAFDPVSTLVVRSPTLNFWTHIPVPHIRVHLPRAINSLAVFKGKEENARDRRRNQRSNLTDPSIVEPATGSENEAREDEDRVVGGDGHGGGLVHDSTRLFEIEVNTIKEMSDDMWTAAGGQLPPQVCRMLVEHGSAWDRVPYTSNADSSGALMMDAGEDDGFLQLDIPPSSPSTSDYDSPTFDSGSESDDEADGGDDYQAGAGEHEDGGDTYDSQAAQEQERRLRERKAVRARQLDTA